MSLDKHVNRILDLKVSEHLDVGNGQTGVYAKKWVDEKSNRVVIYYFETSYDANSRKLNDFINVKGKTFEIEYWKEQRPVLATEQEKEKMYEKARATGKGKHEKYFG